MAPSEVARASRAASPSVRVKPGLEAKEVFADENTKVNVDTHKTVDSVYVKTKTAEPVTSALKSDVAPTADAVRPCQGQRKWVPFVLLTLLCFTILSVTLAVNFPEFAIDAVRSNMEIIALRVWTGCASALGFAFACISALRRCRVRSVSKKTA